MKPIPSAKPDVLSLPTPETDPLGLSAKPDTLSDSQQMTKLPRRTGCQSRLGSTSSSPIPALETDPLGSSVESATLLDGQHVTELPSGTGWEARQGSTRGTGCRQRLGSTSSSSRPALETDQHISSAMSDTMSGHQMTMLPRGTGWEVREGRRRGTGWQATGGGRTPSSSPPMQSNQTHTPWRGTRLRIPPAPAPAGTTGCPSTRSPSSPSPSAKGGTRTKNKGQRDADNLHHDPSNQPREPGGCLELYGREEQAELFISGQGAASSLQPHPSSFTSATPSPKALTRVSSITSSSTAQTQRQNSGTEHSQIGREERSGSSQSTSGTSSRRRTFKEGASIPAKKVISIYEEGNKFGGEHLSFHGQGAWRGPTSSNPASSSSRTTSPSSSSSSTSSTQSGRDLRGSGGSGAILVTYNCKFNGTLCATDTLACRSNFTGGKTTSVSLGENNQLIN